MRGLDTSRIPAKGITLALARWSNAFGGGGRGSRKGVERGRLTRKDGELRCTWEAAFDEFGPSRFRITATVADARSPKTIRTDWREPARGARAIGGPDGRTWRFEVTDAEGTDTVSVPLAAAALPTTLQRFVPLLMPRTEGSAVSFASLPEDAFPFWRPRAKGSFFPLDAEPGARTIRCTGAGELKRGREVLRGWAFEQHGDGEDVERWWLVSDAGGLLAMAAKKTLWLPEDPNVVSAELARR